MKPRLLHIGQYPRTSRCVAPGKFQAALRELGELTILENGKQMTVEKVEAQVRECDIYLAGWDSIKLPTSLAKNPGKLKYVCGITGTMRDYVPAEIVAAGIPLTNWGDTPANSVAEAAMALLLASLKGMHARVDALRNDGWQMPRTQCGGTLEGATVGIYGCGVIGRRFLEMIKPFGPVIRLFDPYLSQTPEGCTRVSSLRELFSGAQIIVIHAGLTPETRNSVTGELLALMPDGGIVINTARGGIIDQAALFAELEKGRLRAGLDVLEPDTLPAGHPARKWTNVIFTAHQAESPWPLGPDEMSPMHYVTLENIRNWMAGRPLKFAMDITRYERST